jgi:hypothetical protein
MNNQQYGQTKQTRKKRKANKRKRAVQMFMFILLCSLIAFAVFLVGINDGTTRLNFPNFKNSDTISQLQQMSESNKKISNILTDIEEYPDNLLELLVRNPETTDFVLHYPDKKGGSKKIKLTNSEINDEIPLFLQWDERWGYDKYGDDIIALAGCGPTCLSMVIVGVTGNVSANPKEIAQFSEARGYYSSKGTNWALLTQGVESYGLQSKEIPLWESGIAQEIQNGNPVICSMKPGDFTTTGHFIVIYGYEDGYFLIHDPNSIERSNKKWTYDSIKDQIRNLWSYSQK